jgi:hypothetical protein
MGLVGNGNFPLDIATELTGQDFQRVQSLALQEFLYIGKCD